MLLTEKALGQTSPTKINTDQTDGNGFDDFVSLFLAATVSRSLSKPSSRVVEHDEDEQQQDHQQTAAEDVLARSETERMTPSRLQHVDENLPAVEDGNGQEVQDGDVDAQQGDQVEQALEA